MLWAGNIGIGQIGILFTFSGGGQFSRCTWRIARDIRHSQMTDDGNVPAFLASDLPSCQGERVKPYGLLLSDIERPFGSFVTDISAATKALAMTSLRVWCLVIFPEARSHTKLWTS